MMHAGVLRLTPLEVVAGIPIGAVPGPSPLPSPPRYDPLAALEGAILPAITRNPCVVSFSGGRDSSTILAVATRIARREGLSPPIPVTLRFPAAPESHEAAWQERVLRHLALTDWVRVELSDEVDLIGPIASPVLRRHGLLWPPNTHFHQPVLELARGGAVITGIDGDGVFGSWRWTRLVSVLARRLRPEPRDALRLLLALAPPMARRAVEASRPQTTLSWLRPATMAALERALSVDRAREPVRWGTRVAWFARRRSLRLVLHSFDLIADDARVLAVHPFADSGFLAALAHTGGWSGFGDRTAVMRTLFAELLPDDVLARQTKARLDGPFWNRHSREFVAQWNGTGIDAEMVDVDALWREWSNPLPHAWTSTLLQAAWLAQHGRRPPGSSARTAARARSTVADPPVTPGSSTT